MLLCLGYYALVLLVWPTLDQIGLHAADELKWVWHSCCRVIREEACISLSIIIRETNVRLCALMFVFALDNRENICFLFSSISFSAHQTAACSHESTLWACHQIPLHKDACSSKQEPSLVFWRAKVTVWISCQQKSSPQILRCSYRVSKRRGTLVLFPLWGLLDNSWINLMQDRPFPLIISVTDDSPVRVSCPYQSASHQTMSKQKRKWTFQPWIPTITPSTSTQWINNPFPEIVLLVFTTDVAVWLSTGPTVAAETDGAPVQHSDVTGKQQSLVWTPAVRRHTYPARSKSFYLTDRNNRRKLHHFDNHRLGGKLNVQDLI